MRLERKLLKIGWINAMRELTSRDGDGAIGCMHEQNRIWRQSEPRRIVDQECKRGLEKKLERIEKFTG